MAGHDFVIHFAAESHVDRSIHDASAFVQTNVLGTFNVLESSRKVGIKTVIHMSSDCSEKGNDCDRMACSALSVASFSNWAMYGKA